jgi:HEAT repeat protein
VAAEALGRIGSTGATQALLTALADAQMTTRRHAALGAIEALGEPAVSPLEKMLASADAPARSNAAEALGWIASPASIAALVQAMGDSEPVVRAQAAWALGELAAPQARAALERAQGRDESLAVRQAAGQALTQFAELPAVRTSPVASGALALNRWETLLWLIPALSMLAAVWLVVGYRRRSLALVAQREARCS